MQFEDKSYSHPVYQTLQSASELAVTALEHVLEAHFDGFDESQAQGFPLAS